MHVGELELVDSSLDTTIGEHASEPVLRRDEERAHVIR